MATELIFDLAPIGRKDRVRHRYQFTKVGQMATRMQTARLMEGWPKRKLHWECSYEIYRCLQREAHTLFGCNLKRALKLFGCNVKIRHTTKNGCWVWMK